MIRVLNAFRHLIGHHHAVLRAAVREGLVLNAFRHLIGHHREREEVHAAPYEVLNAFRHLIGHHWSTSSRWPGLSRAQRLSASHRSSRAARN
ncbi:hypothetical protein NITMOv2_1514 [Nitrospira moscoviensis]|uniref:Uncharacterized protein n=1 Tax=Nitrospira moscoviensis TaxID=42253 RepID=A0A0K2GAH8_NITMO|nr:hypothetical protein NITMOv2_1514 [Nitrospira moscoviensis]